jgi:toxin ParE1/3/4
MPSSPKLRISPEALDDIRDLLQYSLQTWGIQQRDRYRSVIYGALQQLAKYPAIGEARDDLGPGYRCRLVEHHVVYYRIEPNSIRVLRVLHVRRDAPRELGDKPLVASIVVPKGLPSMSTGIMVVAELVQ